LNPRPITSDWILNTFLKWELFKNENITEQIVITDMNNTIPELQKSIFKQYQEQVKQVFPDINW